MARKNRLFASLANSINAATGRLEASALSENVSTIDSAEVNSLISASVSSLVNSAPETLNTLDELAAALGDQADFATVINNQIAEKADASSLASVATSGSYDDLLDIPSDTPEFKYLQLFQNGTLESMVGDTRWVAPRNLFIKEIRATVGTASTGADLIIRINKNSTILNTVTVNSGALSSTNDGLSYSVSSGDYLTIDITQIGSTVAGSDLNVIITYIDG